MMALKSVKQLNVWQICRSKESHLLITFVFAQCHFTLYEPWLILEFWFIYLKTLRHITKTLKEFAYHTSTYRFPAYVRQGCCEWQVQKSCDGFDEWLRGGLQLVNFHCFQLNRRLFFQTSLTHYSWKGNVEVRNYESLLNATDYKKVTHSQLFSADKLVERPHVGRFLSPCRAAL